MIVLASASPRRKELLGLITQDFEVAVSGADESCDISQPREMVRALAIKKAEAVQKLYAEDTIIGADTVVEVNGKVFGKPKSSEDARAMLTELAGRAHFVHTGVCVLRGARCIAEAFTTRVVFCPLTSEEITDYLRQENVMDKAGAYAIQGSAAKFVTGIDGCFFNVVGLPISGVYRMLKEAAAISGCR
ncbi:MAG: Maf family protein [Christensenella sp.]